MLLPLLLMQLLLLLLLLQYLLLLRERRVLRIAIGRHSPRVSPRSAFSAFLIVVVDSGFWIDCFIIVVDSGF